MKIADNAKRLKINELEVGKLYNIMRNPHRNRIYYYVDRRGDLFEKDIISKCSRKSLKTYNEVIKMVFIEHFL